MSLEINRSEVIRLFDEKIYPHIIGDLKILDTIQPKTHRNGCSIPTVMLILSALDFIGYLLRPSGGLDESEDNITMALTYSNYFPGAYTPEVIKKISIFYRHGVMHAFYPRQTSTETYAVHKSDNQVLLEQSLENGISITSLNVNVFSDDFKAFVDRLYNEIKTTTDNTLLENMLKSFKIIRSGFTTSSTTTTETTMSFGVPTKK